MTQSYSQLKYFWAKHSVWLYRFAFVALTGLLSYLASRSAYNYSHWLPHSLLRRLGLSYNSLLWFEQHADSLLHFFGALLLTLTLSAARLPYFKQAELRPGLFVVMLCIGAEALQLLIGREVESRDLLLGILGSFMAYLAIDKNIKNVPSDR